MPKKDKKSPAGSPATRSRNRLVRKAHPGNIAGRKTRGAFLYVSRLVSPENALQCKTFSRNAFSVFAGSFLSFLSAAP